MSSDSEEEDFVLFGTPLDPIEEDAIPSGKFQKVENQIATDEYGRRRFHGAFTGGYSAGFFNSVGSLEGWKPTNFKSSKSSKAECKVQRPEDFMDEEDTSEYGIAPKALRVKSLYNDSSSIKRKLPQYSSGPIPGVPVLSEILNPVKETVGMKLLKAMGWKPGQGIGPRVTRTEKTKIKNRRKKSSSKGILHGCDLGPLSKDEQSSEESEECSDDDLRDVLFAPSDFDQFVAQPKTNLFGIGYSGLNRQPVLSVKHYSLFDEPSGVNLIEGQKKVSVRGQAFGVGVFENEDDDIYAQLDMSQYDFSLPCPGSSSKKENTNQSKFAITHQSDIIEGFVEAAKFILKKKFFTPPIIPHGFQPSGLKSTKVLEPKKSFAATSKERASILGEVSRWSCADEKKEQPQAQESSTSDVTPIISVEKSSFFKPFANDPMKQKRYEQYQLFVKLGEKERLASIQPSSMTEWEKERERIEFEGSLRLYKPLSGDIADRFTSAQQQDDSLDPLVPVARTVDPTLQQMQDATKMKMFGNLTRQVSTWQPDSLIFKRFNIAESAIARGSLDSALEKKNSRPKFSVFSFMDVPSSSSDEPVVGTNVVKEVPIPVDLNVKSEEIKPEFPTSLVADVKNQEIIELAISERLKIFQEIFLASSDEEDDELSKKKINSKSCDENSRAIEPPADEESVIDVNKNAQNTIRNKAPAKGIFANLDLDKLSVPPVSEENSSKAFSSSDSSSDNDEERISFYGPQLPNLISSKTAAPAAKVSAKSLIENSKSSQLKGKWVEEKPKHSKHKKHKKEHKKHKSKHKKKKHKR